jgi:replicative DNA helicase
MGDILKVFLPRMDGFRDGSIQPAWVPHVQALRDIMDYVDDTDFIIEAARPGEGKSSHLRYEALQSCLKGNKVVTFNLENDELEYAKFALSAFTGIDSFKLKNPRLLSPADLETVQGAAVRLSELPWKIITLARPTAKDIDRIARKTFAQDPFDMMQVDYIQLISNGLENRVVDLSETSSILRGIAIRLHQPVIAASQFSRAIEHRGDNADPVLADLRESGSLEQDATVVWALRSLWNNPPTLEQIANFRFPENFDMGGRALPVARSIPMRMFVLKNRNGPIGITDPIKWNKSTGVFQTLTRDTGSEILRSRNA